MSRRFGRVQRLVDGVAVVVVSTLVAVLLGTIDASLTSVAMI